MLAARKDMGTLVASPGLARGRFAGNVGDHLSESFNVARLFRLWEKKRGQRRTGSKLVGSMGEAFFFGSLFLLGAALLTLLISSHVIEPQPGAYALGSGYGFWLMVLVLASFVLIGGGGLIFTALQVGTSTERRSAIAQRARDIELISDALPHTKAYPSVPSDDNLTNSPGTRLAYRLPLTHTLAWSVTAATVFFLVWNGITIVLLMVVVNGFFTGHPNWLLAVFTLTFVAIAAWSTNYFIRTMLIHTGIGPTSVEVSHHPLQPGRAYEVFLSQAGQLRLDSLQLALVCEEEATFQQGTDLRTDHQVVFRDLLFRQHDFTIEPGVPFEHQCKLTLPNSAMHSFRATHNAVHWKLIVTGEGKSWRSFTRMFPIVVLPPVDGDAVYSNTARKADDEVGR